MGHVGKARQRIAAAPDTADAIDIELTALSRLLISELRAIWRERLECEPPKLRSRSVLLNELAWRIQVDAFGDLDSVTERRLFNRCETAVVRAQSGATLLLSPDFLFPTAQ